MSGPDWDLRIQRAEELAASQPFASEILGFYKQVTSFQKELYGEVLAACGTAIEKKASGSLRDELDLTLLLPRFPAFLSFVERVGSPTLAEFARELSQLGADRWTELLTTYWQAGGRHEPSLQGAEAFCARVILQPYAEYLAAHTERPPTASALPICPLCQGMPQVRVLRQEGDGAKRSLVCALCLTEWDYRRIVCPACEEEDPEKICIYSAREFEHVRVEACDTCKTYIKTIDLTRNGRAVPVVDELASVPLNLWAQEKGYVKLQPNLLGL